VLERVLVALPVVWWSTPDSQAIEKAKTILSKNQRGEEFMQAGYLLGVGAADISAEVIGRVIDDYGIGNVESSDLIEEIADFEDFPVLGGLFTFSTKFGQRAPVFMQLWRVSSGGDWIPIGDGGNVPDFESVNP
jgi:hypothetical protein